MRTWWIARRAELVVERIGSRTLNSCGGRNYVFVDNSTSSQSHWVSHWVSHWISHSLSPLHLLEHSESLLPLYSRYLDTTPFPAASSLSDQTGATEDACKTHASVCCRWWTSVLDGAMERNSRVAGAGELCDIVCVCVCLLLIMQC